MPGTNALPLNVVVAGGSIGGLCAGVALRAIGCDVSIYERSPGPMADRGAGIVAQPDLYGLLQRYGAPPLFVTTATRRRYVRQDGHIHQDMSMPQQFTSWNAIYRSLRAVFPDEHYHLGQKIERATSEGSVRVQGIGERQADLVVLADGFRSETREAFLPDSKPRYAGYIAWRGVIDESDLSSDLKSYFDDAFSLCTVLSGGHILCYFIPGEGDAGAATDQRRLNWVWYVMMPPDALQKLLGGHNALGQRYALSPGSVTADHKRALMEKATNELPAAFAAMVQATPEPFVQVIVDLAVPQMLFGRTCLIGDAAFVVRPHTAAGTSKAAADASALADALRSGDPLDEALADWEQRQLAMGQEIYQRGIVMGRRL